MSVVRRRRPVLLAVLAVIGCGGGDPVAPSDSGTSGTTPDTDVTDTDTDTDPGVDTDTDQPDPETVPLAGACPMATDFGGFHLASDALLTSASGAVTDGVVPVTVLDEVAASGDCVLLQRNNPFCDPPCPPSETCDFDGSCVPYPVQQDVGTVTIDGLHEKVTMVPTSPGFSYYELGLSHPPYAPGDLVTLRVAGAGAGALTLYAVGIEPLTVPDSEWVLAEGSDATIRWDAPAVAARSTVRLQVNIDQHGTTPVLLTCEFPDTGEGVVPTSLVDAFIAFGVTGFPSASLTRHTVDSATYAGGCVDFEVSWRATADLRVEGYVPCTKQEDCPTGTTCNERLEICE